MYKRRSILLCGFCTSNVRKSVNLCLQMKQTRLIRIFYMGFDPVFLFVFETYFIFRHSLTL